MSDRQSPSYRVVILGASYGSLLGYKLALAGHHVTLACMRDEADLINREGVVINMPFRDLGKRIDLKSKDCSGSITAVTPDAVAVDQCDLCCIAIQEPHLGKPELKKLFAQMARKHVPVLSIMNMPTMALLTKLTIPTGKLHNNSALERCFHDPDIWRDFDADFVTHASPDAQASRVIGMPKNVLRVNLATNFKAAPFGAGSANRVLADLADTMAASRIDLDGIATAVPVRLVQHASPFVPMAKWPMLMGGNYRCIQSEAPISIKQAVLSQEADARAVYEWTADLCQKLGAPADALVEFDRYKAAAENLVLPSSVARALHGGATAVERADRLIIELANMYGMENPTLIQVSKLIDLKLAENMARAPHV